MENKKSLFNRFSDLFKSKPWYLPFPPIIQDFAVRFASEDKSENNLFKQTKKMLLLKYKEIKLNKDLAELDYESLAKHIYSAVYEDDIILPNLIKIGDEEFLFQLYFEINDKPNSTDLKICIVSNPNCPVEIIQNAMSSEQPTELRKVSLLRNEVSYTEKVYALQDVLVGDSNLELKNYFSLNLQPTVSDVPGLMDLLSENALNNRMLTSLWLKYDKYCIKISGYICEGTDSYKTADLVLENTVLFREENQDNEIVQIGTFKNRDAATSFLKKKFGSIPFVVRDFVVPESELQTAAEIPGETEDAETYSVSEETTDNNTTYSKKGKHSKK